ncbi:MAG: hypothetical protein KBF99_03700 [Leptospiraceae bacterium]|nr:hypothetical protein [Leptospiraceae bacterium]MBK7053959.1 hypothetical protein [Leptospiraceae bacterium]MBK9499920.1 hypothetical protein [Leptospiraceae bacterium]MBL0263515.1 hypothetical protein [Leptospiraceae bacterium]MBP9162257.1 hypothetical protein [Leptospiraceae bacterium]
MSLLFIASSFLAIFSGIYLMYSGMRKMQKSDLKNIQTKLDELDRKQIQDHNLLEELASRK